MSTRVTVKGQVTLPKSVRGVSGNEPGIPELNQVSRLFRRQLIQLQHLLLLFELLFAELVLITIHPALDVNDA